MFQNKRILLGVSGSIAAYKAAELARLFQKEGASVQVVMTRSAQKFIAPLTFFSLTGNQVYSEMFSGGPEEATAHIELARKADLVIVAPATASTIARIAQGMADDLLTTTIIAADTPVVLAPAMNPQMYKHPGVKENLARIKRWPGYFIAPPGEGELACGEFGLGRLAEPRSLVEYCAWVLDGGKQDMKDEQVVVTAGPTFEDIDPVRFVSNRSTGKMGFALARVAARRGAQVKLITATTHLPLPPGCQHIATRSALEMASAVQSHVKDASVLLMAAAVADYRPDEVAAAKIKKEDGPLTLTMTRTIDILGSLTRTPGRITVGFAAETEDLLKNAADKLKRKHMDLIVANDITQPGSGFAVDTNRVVLLNPDGQSEALPLMSKEKVAEAICDRVVQIRAARNIVKKLEESQKAKGQQTP